MYLMTITRHDGALEDVNIDLGEVDLVTPAGAAALVGAVRDAFTKLASDDESEECEHVELGDGVLVLKDQVVDPEDEPEVDGDGRTRHVFHFDSEAEADAFLTGLDAITDTGAEDAGKAPDPDGGWDAWFWYDENV